MFEYVIQPSHILFSFLTLLQLQTRSRLTGIQRPKVNGDENATSKHSRQLSGSGATRASMVLRGLKNEPQRPALGEVTTTAVNRKVCTATLCR